MLNSESNLQNQVFCKFRGLDYNGNLIHFPNKCVSYKLNSRFLDILKNCRLYGASFNDLNDRDEGRFLFSEAQLEKAKEIRNEKTMEDKKRLKICCFSLEEAELDMDLMWAHYGNGHCGVKIDFMIDGAYRGKVFKMCYGKKPAEYNGQDLEPFIKEILTNKKQCFAYENEYRAIWKEGGDYLPIQILKITLGRRFTRETIFSDETENIKFNENDDVVRIAKQFLDIWEKGVHNRGGEKPEFYAYKTKYSPKPKPISFDILEKVRL